MSNITATTTRKCLADVEPEELRAWLIQRRKWLTGHKRFVQRYLQGLADDLLELIDSVVANVDQYAQEQRYIQELEAELACLREAERRRLMDTALCGPGAAGRGNMEGRQW